VNGRVPPRLPPVFQADRDHPMLDDFSLRALRHQAKQAPGTPIVAPIPVRQHPIWSGNNEIGRETAFAPDENNRQTILKMGEWGAPQLWTVTLGMDYSRPLAEPINTAFTVLAEIQFGSGGTTQTIEVDWRQGASVSVVANAIVVNAVYPFQEVGGASTPTDLVLRASVGKRSSAGGAPTRSFTSQLFDNAASVSGFIRVPPFAKAIKIYPYSNILTVTHFQFYTSVLVQQSMGTDNSVNIIGFPATQFLSFLDFTNEFVGSIRAIPLLEGTRTIFLTWAPGGVPAPPPASFGFGVEFDLAL
jgi:hypothetical protein